VAKGNDNAAKDRENSAHTSSVQTVSTNKASTAKAAASHTNRGTVQRMDQAERKMGRLLGEMEKAKGAAGSGSNQYEVRSHDETAPTLSSLGVSKSMSARAQAIRRSNRN